MPSVRTVTIADMLSNVTDNFFTLGHFSSTPDNNRIDRTRTVIDIPAKINIITVVDGSPPAEFLLLQARRVAATDARTAPMVDKPLLYFRSLGLEVQVLVSSSVSMRMLAM